MFKIFIILILLSCDSLTKNKPRETLLEVYNEYITAIIERDIDKMMSTLKEDTTFHFLTTQGTFITTRNEYRSFHEAWFREEGWEISFGHPLIRYTEKAGYVISEFHYSRRIGENQILQLYSWVTLVFQYEKNHWKITADITTPIKRNITETTH